MNAGQEQRDTNDAAADANLRRGRSELLRPVLEPAITMESVQLFVQAERTRTRRMVLWLGLFFLLLVGVVMTVLIAGGIYIARGSLGSASDIQVLTKESATREERVTGLATELSIIERGHRAVQGKVEAWESGADARDERLKGDLQSFSKWVDEKDRKREEAVSALAEKVRTLEAALKDRDAALSKAQHAVGSPTDGPAMSSPPPAVAAAPVTPSVTVPVAAVVSSRVTTPVSRAAVTNSPARLSKSEVVARSVVVVPSVSPEEMMSQTFPNGDRYRGQFKDGVMHGWGTYEEADGTVYEGPYVEGRRQGKGIVRAPDGTRYEGDFVADRMHGYGVDVLPNGDKYSGQIIDGRIEGFGTMDYSNGNEYVGEFRAGKKHGIGTFTFSNGDVYEGPFVDDTREGKGAYRFSDGSTYVGDFKAGIRQGTGTYTYPGGEQYIGPFRDGKKNGKGTCIYPDGTRIETQWKDDQLVQ